MITLGNLPSVKTRSKKRLGRGYGSGKGGHTSSRGQKGQKTRSTIYPLFEGTKNKKSLIQRLPLLRGKGKLKPKKKPFELDADRLEIFPAGSTVNVAMLIEKGLVPAPGVKNGVKIIGGSGRINKMKINGVSFSQAAERKLKSAEGAI